MGKRVLLVSLNRETDPYPVFPIGVWMLAEHLRRAGLEASVADLLLLGGPGALEEQVLARGTYDAVGLSIRNVDNLAWPDSRSYLSEIEETLAVVRRHVPEERIILGGAGYSIFGEALGRRLGIGQAVRGEGEQGLLRALGIEQGPAPSYGYLDTVPADVVSRYDVQAGMLGIQTRRGCPFDCAYCTYPQIEGRRMRFRAVDAVAADLARLRGEHGVRAAYLVDCNVNVPAPYTADLLAALAAAGPVPRWYAFFHPGYFDVDLAERLQRAGCAGVEFGAESGDPLMLTGLRKNITPGQIRAASQVCRDAGLKFCHYLLLGAPGETAESVAASLDLMHACAPSTVIISTGLRVYPGTGIADDLVRAGELAPGHDLLEPWFYRPPTMDLPRILEYCQKEVPEHWILSGIDRPDRKERMAKLRQMGVRGPLWDYL